MKDYVIGFMVKPENLKVEKEDKLIGTSGDFPVKILQKYGTYKEKGHKLDGKKITIRETNYEINRLGKEVGTYWGAAKIGDTKELHLYIGKWSKENRYIDSAILHIGPKSDLERAD